MKGIHVLARGNKVTLPNSVRRKATHLSTHLFCSQFNRQEVLTVLDKDHYLHQTPEVRFNETFISAMVGGDLDTYFNLGEERLLCYPLILNTAWVLSSDPVRLLLRLDAQSENNLYCESKYRGWLNKIIQQGIDSGLYDEPIWESAMKVIATDSTIVFSSPSGSTGTPDKVYAIEAGYKEKDYERFRPRRQWTISEKSLKKRYAGKRMDLNPNDWMDYRFGHAKTAFDVLKFIHSKKEKTNNG